MLNKKDFIEIEFTARVKDGEVFDSNIKEDLEKTNLNVDPKPFIFSLGEGMFLKGIEDFLIGKPETPASYEIELPAEKAFGARNLKLIQLMPLRIFREQNINPIPGFMFNFDGRIAKILSASGGRVRVDFNNPISGKDVVYKLKVLRKIDDLNEKTKAFINSMFKRDFNFEIKDKKLTIFADSQFVKFLEIFKEKFKELLGLEMEAKEIQKDEKKEEKGDKKENDEVKEETHNHKH
jgi:FKBP-type peptidyl-prolyl cis-trans isomerase SlyD